MVEAISIPQADTRRLRAVTVLLATACGLAVANIYYAQPLLALLATTFKVSKSDAALVVTVTQIGYALGLVLIVPLGDLLENRRLATWMLIGAVVALICAAAAPSLGVLLLASLAIGLTSVVAQVLVPLAAHLAPPEQQGAVVGRVMSGLLLGILLARTTSSLIAAAFGWRCVYAVSACLIFTLAVVVAKALPQREPQSTLRYPALIRSLAGLARSEPVLRRRAAYQASMFAVFSAFWTSISYELQQHHHLGQASIGLFSLVGAAGAAAAPVAGRLGDLGKTHAATGAGLLIGSAAIILSLLTDGSVVGLAISGLILDLCAQTTLVLGQRAIYAARPDSRARMNAVYLASMFVGGSVGSACSGLLYNAHGWAGVVIFAAPLPLLAFLLWLRSPSDQL
ncbi:MAG: MFS transporter [Frankia sp.]